MKGQKKNKKKLTPTNQKLKNNSQKTQSQNEYQKPLLRNISLILLAVIALLIISLLFSTRAKRINENQYTKIDLYFLNSTANKIETETRSIPNSGTNAEILEAVLNELIILGPRSSTLSKTVPDSVSILDDIELDDTSKIVKITFSNSYKNLSPKDEVFCRTSLVWTLTELEFVNNVDFYVENERLLKPNGEPMGLQNRDNVKIDTNPISIKKEEQEVKLYFCDPEGDGLVLETRSVQVAANQPVEKSIVQGLIDGPKNASLIRTIPAETKIRDVSISDDKICYVDLSSDFISKFDGNPNIEYLAVYSIVNSLTELSNVQKVQILVEGDRKHSIQGNYSMDISSPFERIEELILE